VLLAELARTRLARVISSRYRDRQRKIVAMLADHSLEELLRTGQATADAASVVRVSPQTNEQICHAIGLELEKFSAVGRPPIVLASADVRAALRQVTLSRLPQLVVLSYDEITSDTQVDSLGTIFVDDLDERSTAYAFQAA
jgi:flagellar biosynthesis protein FlhA